MLARLRCMFSGYIRKANIPTHEAFFVMFDGGLPEKASIAD